jgi:Mb-OB3b family methanobactin precursor
MGLAPHFSVNKSDSQKENCWVGESQVHDWIDGANRGTRVISSAWRDACGFFLSSDVGFFSPHAYYSRTGDKNFEARSPSVQTPTILEESMTMKIAKRKALNVIGRAGAMCASMCAASA